MSRKTILVLGAAALAAALLALFWRGPGELEQWKSGMAAQGEKFTFRELGAKYSPEVASFHRQFTGTVSRLHFRPVYPGGLDTMKPTKPGRARVLWRQPAPLDEERADNTWEHFAAQMGSNAPALAVMRDLLARWPAGKFGDPADPIGASIYNLVAVRKGAQMLNGAVIDELHRGQLDPAITNVAAIIALGRIFDDAGSLVERMIGVAILGLGLNATWEALQAPGWDEARLADVQRRWQQCDWIASLARTAEAERAFIVWAYQDCRTNRTEMNNMLPDMGINSTNWLAEAVNDSIVKPVWRKAWSKKDELLYLQTMQPVVLAMRETVTNRSWQTLRRSLQEAKAQWTRQRSALDQFRYPMCQSVIPNWEKASLHLMRLETRRQLTATALALRRWQLRHGRAPERLDELVPAFLPAPPRDCMDGAVLRYRREGDGGFRLYSVGEDGQDDGGDGDDILWPAADR